MNTGFTISEETPDREYFTIVPNYIINHSTIWERDIYLIMKRIAGEKGNCFASHQTIAEKTGVSRPTISRTIKKLLERGWIEETGKVAGKTHPTKNYVIVDLWQVNSDYYKDKKIRKPENQSPQNTKDTSTTEPKIRKPQIYKEDHIEEDILKTNVLSTQSGYGNPEINKLVDYLKEKLELPDLDGGQRLNRKYAWILLGKSKKGADGVRWLIDQAANDRWFKNHITSFRDLWANSVKIVSTQRGGMVY